MWPFKKKPKVPAKTPAQPAIKGPAQTMPISQFSYSQIDITERFDDNLRLGPEDWTETIALNATTRNPEDMGLPPVNATEEKVYEIASKLSKLRESLRNSNDGVYCPICHMANIDRRKIRTPCPKCGRGLLSFGWD